MLDATFDFIYFYLPGKTRARRRESNIGMVCYFVKYKRISYKQNGALHAIFAVHFSCVGYLLVFLRYIFIYSTVLD